MILICALFLILKRKGINAIDGVEAQGRWEAKCLENTYLEIKRWMSKEEMKNFRTCVIEDSNILRLFQWRLFEWQLKFLST